jgi:general secretion pathway protein I
MRCESSGFTLLEVMVSLAIMAGVILTVLGSVNYHIGIIANERDSTTLTLLAQNRMAELDLENAYAKGEGTFAPSHPELTWKTDLLPADFPGIQKFVVRVRRGSDGREVALVRYIKK